MSEAIIGIDYSMTSPALCIGLAGASFQDCYVYCFGNKSQQGTHGKIRIDAKLDYLCNEERFWNNTKWVIDCIADYENKTGNIVKKVNLEGYAFGSSSGLVFQIAENTSVLKHYFWKHNIPLETIPPTTLKKFVTGKGNAKKEAMYDVFLEETGDDLQKQLSPKAKKIGNPVSDIVDSYYLMRYVAD